MPPSLRTDSGDRPSSSRNVRQASTSPPGWIVISPMRWLWSRVASSVSAESARAGGRSSSSRPSGRTRIFSEAVSAGGPVMLAIRPSVAAMAGCPVG
jgi:hypothetical protein